MASPLRWKAAWLLCAVPCASISVVQPTLSEDFPVSSRRVSAWDSSTSGSKVSVHSKMDDYHLAYHYMPEQHVVICACAKCGSTSLYEFVYAEVFGHNWTYPRAPYVMDVDSQRWNGTFQLISPEDFKKVIDDPKTFSLGLVRDPKDRLISAWKSKVACGWDWGTDYDDRARFVPALLELAGQKPTPEVNETCLSFEDFVQVMGKIHKAGKDEELNPHFLPQHLGCFRDVEASRWSKVAVINNEGAAQELAARLGDDKTTNFPNIHASVTWKEVTVDTEIKKQLDKITKDEYASFAASNFNFTSNADKLYEDFASKADSAADDTESEVQSEEVFGAEAAVLPALEDLDVI